MYSKIAFSNVKKSIRDYTIYFLTLTFGICLFYMFNSVQAQQAVLKLNESQKSMMHLMSVIINWISVFVAVILGFLIIYAISPAINAKKPINKVSINKIFETCRFSIPNNR